MSGSLLQELLHRVRPPSSLPLVTSWPTMRASVSSPYCLGSLTSMPKPLRKPWSRRTSTVGWFCGEVEHGDLRARRLVAEGALAPTCRSARRPGIVGGERGVGGVDRIERGVERDDKQAGVARLLIVGTMAAESLGAIMMPLAPAAIRFSIAATWHSLSPRLAGERPQLDAELLGLRLGALAAS